MPPSLYRRWRPKSFAELVGQDAVVRTLRAALASGRLSHAYLFSGPRGSGKTSAAKILARCIDCVLGPTPDPDNTCEYCLAMLAGTALDVIEIDAASNRGIDEIRALRESVKFAPATMRAKVFIIDEAHMLTREGANAFLKTLEEPPSHAVFILATTAPEALPPTILSRCQRYAFRRIPVPTMIAKMREIALAEGIAIDDDALGAIAYRADGGLRDALTMLEQVAAFAGSTGGTIDPKTVEAAFGSTGRAYARSLVAALLDGDARRAFVLVDEASDAGTDLPALIRASVAEFRNLLVARIDPALLARDLAPEDAAAATARAGEVPQAKVVRALRLLADALAAGRVSGNPRLELETAILRLVVSGEDPTIEALSTRLALVEERIGGVQASPSPPRAEPSKAAPSAESRPAAKTKAPEMAAPVHEKEAPVAQKPETSIPENPPAAAKAPATTEKAGPLTLQQVRSRWEAVRLRAYERQAPLRGPLAQATVDSLEGDVLTIGLVDPLQESLVRAKQDVVEAALAEVLGTALKVALRSSGGAPARAGRASGQSSAHRAVPRDAAPAEPSESAPGPGGESDLLAYARTKLSDATTRPETR